MAFIWMTRKIITLELMCLFLVSSQIFAVKIKEAEDYGVSTKFDYIIVGGGTTGCPLAATLSQNFKVLLLERGGSSFGNPNISSIRNAGANIANQGPGAPAQSFMSTEGVPNIRAQVLGGGSSINLGFYNRGSPDQIKQLGIDGSLANDSFEWIENAISSIPSNVSRYQAGFKKALLEAGVTPDNGASFDFQVGTQIGANIFDDQGTRRPASNLLLQYANSRNLLVLIHAEVELILINRSDPAENSLPKAVGVRYSDPFGKQHNVFLHRNRRSEVILCAGTLGSPQLLLLSGIGPENELRTLGINVILDSPGVGKNVSDNPAIGVVFRSPPPVDSSLFQVAGITSAFGAYLFSSSGAYIAPLTGSVDRTRITTKVAGPRSMGELVLQTRNVSDSPRVTFNYFKDPQDLQTCVAGVNTLEEVMLAHSYRSYVYENQSLPSGGTVGDPRRRNPALSGSVNATLSDYCRKNVRTVYHYHGGCLKGHVLDSDYSVSGTRGLRVVDGSTLEFSPGTNPQATLMMLGRYMGVRILKLRNKEP